ncbi:hypothetical protein THRCLA_06490 [Thraustotheca clavata]|uniref:Lysosomal acid phosphatase n=1 Tax=Thraustotheca clavata TaxID=74557 RepID=A0A1V9ZP19_9STRA|nr:hypothetical protein THRCLA_06490 [Thraustotheca clavata]
MSGDGRLMWICSSLRVVVTLSNHGNRAPSEAASVWCPANMQNIEQYGAPFMQLTDLGMSQLYEAGQHTRDLYVDKAQFLSPSLKQKHHFEAFFRADAAKSCGQSAAMFQNGLNPNNNEKKGWYPIPIIKQLEENELEFSATSGPCKDILNTDLDSYANARGFRVLDQNRQLIENIFNICGNNEPGSTQNTIDKINVIADMVKVDKNEKLPALPKLTDDMYTSLQNLAFNQMMERYLGTPRQVTYYLGGFPNLLLDNLFRTSKESYKLYAYTGHRGLLHGLGLVLGWSFDIPGEATAPAFNTTSLPPGATMYFELHEVDDILTVQTYLWSPSTPHTQVKLSKCSALDCPLDEFRTIFDHQIAATSSWETICNYHPQKAVRNLHFGSTPEAESQTSIIMLAVIVLCTTFAIVSAYQRIHQFRRRQYTQI